MFTYYPSKGVSGPQGVIHKIWLRGEFLLWKQSTSFRGRVEGIFLGAHSGERWKGSSEQKCKNLLKILITSKLFF